MTTPARGERFFFFYSLVLFAIVVVFFPLHALVNSDYLPPIRPLLHVHAVTMGLWFGLIVVQTGLIAKDREDLHRRLGVLSVLLVLVMLPTGIWVSYENFVRTGSPMILIANSGNSLIFLVFYAAALALRARPVFHKRFMMFGALALMIPALGRVGYVFDLPELAPLPMQFALILAIPVYDLVSRRRITLASGIGVVGFIAYTAALIAILSPYLEGGSPA